MTRLERVSRTICLQANLDPDEETAIDWRWEGRTRWDTKHGPAWQHPANLREAEKAIAIHEAIVAGDD